MQDYMPIIIKSESDDNIDYVVMLNKKHDIKEFRSAIEDAEQKLCDLNYDLPYWDAICEYLKDYDFHTSRFSPEVIYY